MALSVRCDENGVWRARLYLGRDRVTGREVRPSKVLRDASTREEALALALPWADGVTWAVRNVDPSLNGMLSWFVDCMEARAPLNTSRAYRACVKRLAPLVGGIRFDELTSADVESATACMLRDPRWSRKTVAQTRAFLSGAYTQWVRDGLVARNPVHGTPGVGAGSPGSDRALSGADAAALDAALREGMARDGPHGGLWAVRCAAAFLALHGGLRRGEALALRLCDLSAARGTVTVSSTAVRERGRTVRQANPKSRSARRTVALSADAAGALSEWRAWRVAEWAPQAARQADPLLCTSSGAMLDPDSVSRWFGGSWQELGVPEGTRFHDLRHTQATLAAAAGVNPREIQVRLGHSEMRTTLENYVGVTPGIDRAAAEAFDAALRTGREEGWE